jgi:hypothetical protein
LESLLVGANTLQSGDLFDRSASEGHNFSLGWLIAPGDPSTAVCMACDTKLRLEDIPERVQRTNLVSAQEEVIFTRLEKGLHHDGVRFANGAEVTLQELVPGVKAIFATLCCRLAGIWKLLGRCDHRPTSANFKWPPLVAPGK